MKETIYIVKRGNWQKTYTTIEGATKALSGNKDNELFEYVLKTKEDNPRVSKLIEPIKEPIGIFLDDVLASIHDTDDMDRKTALLFYATSIKSFIGDGNWRAHIVRSVKWLRAVREKESNEK